MTTTTITINRAGLVCTAITVTAESSASVVEQQIGSQMWRGLMVDGRFFPLVLCKHVNANPLAMVEAVDRALADVLAAIEGLRTPEPPTTTTTTCAAFRCNDPATHGERCCYHYQQHVTGEPCDCGKQPEPPTTTTNADLLDLIREHHATALLHDDYRSARQLDRVRQNLKNGARLSWDAGDLLIQSVNNPGAVYSVNGRRCTCPNGAAGRSSCWHVCLFDLLVELEENRAAIADLLADAAEARAELDDTPPLLGGLRRALDDAATVLGIDPTDDESPADDDEGEDYSIQYEDVPYPHGIGNPDAAAGLGQRIAAARARLAA